MRKHRKHGFPKPKQPLLPAAGTIPKMEAGIAIPANLDPLLSLIATGRRNGITQRQIADALGIDERIVRAMIQKLRKMGVYIMSSDAGYFFPETLEEVKRYDKRVQHSQKETAVAHAPVRRLLKQYAGGDDDAV